VIPYWVSRILGAFVGAAAVYLIYRDGLVAAGMPNVWATGPGAVFSKAFFGSVATPTGTPYSLVTACIAELFGTAILLGGVMAAFDENNVGLKNNLGFLLVGGVVLAIGLSLGGPSGYAINPARDLGPRLFGALAGTTGLFAGAYWIIAPILMPLIGGPLGIVLYDAFIAPGIEYKHMVAAAEEIRSDVPTNTAQAPVPVTGKEKENKM
jgi:glycerol uptake facilitator protein